MTKLGFALAALVFCFYQNPAKAQTAPEKDNENLPHYDLEMTGDEYTQVLFPKGEMEGSILESMFQTSTLSLNDARNADPLQGIIIDGKRNLDWLKYINDHRDADHKISLSSPNTQVGIPIDHPRVYSPQIILKDYQAVLAALPASIKSVIQGTGSFPLNPPTTDDEFIKWSAKVDYNYQMASRWLLMAPNLAQLAQRQSNDVRGYYFLSQDPHSQEHLTHWKTLDPVTRQLDTEYLFEMCLNNGGRNNGSLINRSRNSGNCKAEVATAIKRNATWALYSKYLKASKDLYESFFKVIVPRTDLKWDHQQNTLGVPFEEIADPIVKSFLADNVQDEWHWDQWHLLLNFQAGANLPNMVFTAGATPHVNKVGGNTITMDANQPLTEYNVRWTIRHEFGHVLGFPDCYVEFYDSVKAVMISYQLDITNLMCSRRGHLQALHYDELKRAYDIQPGGLSESNLLKKTDI